MDMIWVSPRDVEPPTGCTFLARTEASGFQAAYSRILDRWYLIIPGGGEEQIDQPEFMFLSRDYVEEHMRLQTRRVDWPPHRLRRKVVEQFDLA